MKPGNSVESARDPLGFGLADSGRESHGADLT